MRKLLETFQELNLSNYGPDDVDQLNAWAIDAYAEQSAIKAQEPAFMWHKGATEDESEVVDVDCACPCCVPLYAAPVSEAKAQGVVMPEREEFEDVYSAEYGTPVSVLKLLREGENYIEKPQHSDRLNSSWWMWQKACARLNAAHAQQVSVPDVSAMARTLADRSADACNVNREDNWAIHGQDYIDDVTAMLTASPAAPAADAGLVEALDYQVLFDAIAAATSVYANGAVNISVQVFRDALAAHRAQGVV